MTKHKFSDTQLGKLAAWKPLRSHPSWNHLAYKYMRAYTWISAYDPALPGKHMTSGFAPELLNDSGDSSFPPWTILWDCLWRSLGRKIASSTWYTHDHKHHKARVIYVNRCNRNNNRVRGPMARRLTTNQEIAGSIPAVLILLLIVFPERASPAF